MKLKEKLFKKHFQKGKNIPYTVKEYDTCYASKLKVGDIFFERDCGQAVECEVITLPKRDNNGRWTWKAKARHLDSEFKSDIHKDFFIVDYTITEGHEHYLHLYDQDWKPLISTFKEAKKDNVE